MEITRLYVLANARLERALRTVAVLKAWCQIHDIEAVSLEEASAPFAENALVVALGGDGTVLRAAAIVADHGVPILGANLGSLGFLTQTGATTLTQSLEAVVRGEFDIEERMRAAYAYRARRGSALNDIVISGRGGGRFCELDLEASEGVVASLPGDGLIVSTATGSTAYSLSTGGPIIVPPAACLLASPLAPHKLGLRPVVFPPEERLRVVAHTPASLFVDGDLVAEIERGEDVMIERAEQPTRLVRLRGAATFFEVLQEKLNWGDDRRRTEPAAAPHDDDPKPDKE
ncbi:MAG: NAD(+)/NADH kinase [Candidatus Bipolaricaulota bacterium]|nr:MAG: NAD(+)/NADH kinase [Candidatus Bipolaricaulota bacterium]